MKLMILMPVHKTMNTSCVISLVDFIQDLHHTGHDAKMIFTNGFNAVKARKALTKHVAENGQDYEYVLWLDSDHIYKQEDLLNLVGRMNDEKLDMLSATYKLHSHPETVHGINEGNGFRHFKEEELKDDIIDCDVVGFGFLVMKAAFVKKMWDKFGEDLFVFDAVENGTEDVKFCRCVLDIGGRVCFDPKVKVGHIESAVRY